MVSTSGSHVLGARAGCVRPPGSGHHLSCTSSGLLLVALFTLALTATDTSAVIIYRLGTPFSAAERDSLRDLSIDFEEIDWSFSQREEGLELDSLTAGSLQPNFFAEDENIAATALSRGGWIFTFVVYLENSLVGQVLLDGDPTTAYEWGAIDPSSIGHQSVIARITVDLGGRFLVKKVKFRPLPENPGRFLERFYIGVTNEPFSTFRLPTLPAALIQKPGGAASMGERTVR